MNIAPSEIAFLVSCGITLTVSLVTTAYLRKPMRTIFIELCGTPERTDFWRAFATVVFVLAPIVLLLMAHAAGRPPATLLLQVADLLKWSLFGLFIAVVSVALTIALFISRTRSTVLMTPDRVDDLNRLLTKVEEMRAREILNRPTANP
jgi:hypothetical protein